MPGRAEVLNSLLEAILDVHVASGRSPEGIDASTEIFGGIDGFDSLNALEVLVIVSAKVNDELPDELLNRNGDGSSPTVGELADRILARLEGDNVDA